MNKDYDTLVSIPKSTSGISQRFIYFLIACVFIFVVLLVYIIAKTAPTNIVKKEEQEVATQINSEALIAQINKDAPQPVVIPSGTPGALKTLKSDSSSKVFEAAGDAPISIYQHEPMSKATLSGEESHLGFQTQPLMRQPNYSEHNSQSEKKAFLKEQETPQTSLSKQRVRKAASKYIVSAGTIVPATLLTGINSDLPNQIIAKVRRAVYDSPTGNYLLVPQGATLIGVYDSQITYGQQRVLVAWSRIIFPSGASINLEGQPGADLVGVAGLADKVNHHRFQLFSSAVMMSLFGAAGQMAQPKERSNGLTNSQIIYGAVGQKLSETASQMIAKSMNIQPTITIRPGSSFNILLTRDFVFPGPYRFNA